MNEPGNYPNYPRRERPNSPAGDYVLGSDGRPLTDRYGRPVRRRSDSPRQSTPAHQAPPRPTPREETRYLPPRGQQQMPPQYAQQPRQQMPLRQERPMYNPAGRPPVQPQVRPQVQPPVQPRQVAQPGRRHLPRRTMSVRGCFSWGLATVLVLMVITVLWSDARLNRVDATPPESIGNTAGTNWLLVGSDSRQGLSEKDIEKLGTGGDIGVGRTDTIMVLHLPTFGEPQLMSIPRDSYVNIPGYGENKINAAFTYGGPELLTYTVEQTTGISIDHYAEIGMGGLASLVDAVGGVEICVSDPIDDPLANINVDAGCQKMDGPTSLGYVRTRATPMGDLDRVARQRDFFSALLHKITTPSTLLNPFRLFPLISRASGTFTVGDGDHVWHLAHVALSMAQGVKTETVPLGGFMDTEVGNVVLWDDTAAEEMFASMR